MWQREGKVRESGTGVGFKSLFITRTPFLCQTLSSEEKWLLKMSVFNQLFLSAAFTLVTPLNSPHFQKRRQLI